MRDNYVLMKSFNYTTNQLSFTRNIKLTTRHRHIKVYTTDEQLQVDPIDNLNVIIVISTTFEEYYMILRKLLNLNQIRSDVYENNRCKPDEVLKLL
jgi:hypothetical protein